MNREVSQLLERHLASNNPADDKLAPFRQQAAIISRKKENVVEQLSELRSRVSALEEELRVYGYLILHQYQLQNFILVLFVV